MEQPALEILNANRIMTIATVRPDGWPQATMWATRTEASALLPDYRTSQKFENIAHDNRVAMSGKALSPASEASELVGRYPNLSELELARLINLYRQFSALDLALMISDEELGPRLDRFFTDHRAKVNFRFASMRLWLVSR